MKTKLSILFLIIFFFTACRKDLDELPQTVAISQESETLANPVELPDGYFEVTFFSGASNSEGMMKLPVSGSDTRVQHIRYIIYDSATGNFVKEKVILSSSTGTSWPMKTAIKDTLKKGSYRVVFLGNVEKSLFLAGTEVLTNYQANYTNARIALPNNEFASNNEYYLANVTFSDKRATPTILLQRIIGNTLLHRNTVDAQKALDTLVYHIITELHFRDSLTTRATKSLTDSITGIFDRLPLVQKLLLSVLDVLGGVTATVDLLVSNIINRLLDLLYADLVKQLTNQIGAVLASNASQSGALGGLGVILNPWQGDSAYSAIVTIDNFPKTVDFNLTVKDVFPSGSRFRYDFTTNNPFAEKDVSVKGFGAQWNIKKINAVRRGLVAGLLVDQTVDGSLLLNGTFIDINDSLKIMVPANMRYADDYSFLDLKLKSYTQTNSGITVTARVGDISNLNGILTGIPILGPILSGTLNFLLSPIGNIVISTSLELPLLDRTNLTLTGGWDPEPLWIK